MRQDERSSRWVYEALGEHAEGDPYVLAECAAGRSDPTASAWPTAAAVARGDLGCAAVLVSSFELNRSTGWTYAASRHWASRWWVALATALSQRPWRHSSRRASTEAATWE